MKKKFLKNLTVIVLALFTFLLGSCAMKETLPQVNESVVMIKTEWNQLRFTDIEKGSLVLKNGRVTYVEGVDYEVDYANGRIRRLEKSKIPDFSRNPLYNAADKSFNHEDYKTSTSFHASYFTVTASYNFGKEANKNDTYEAVLAAANAKNQTAIPINVINKIKNGQDILIGVVGDSISVGAEATQGNEYFTLFAKYLETYGETPVKVDLVNVSVGGDASDAAITRSNQLYQQCTEKEPDLVIIAYGMNDQNSTSTTPRISPQQYVSNIRNTINNIRNLAKSAPDFIVVTAMPANPIWLHTSGKWYDFGNALRDFAKQNSIPIADAGALFKAELDYGQNYEEFIISMINHPGDYGHSLYFRALKSLFTE